MSGWSASYNKGLIIASGFRFDGQTTTKDDVGIGRPTNTGRMLLLQVQDSPAAAHKAIAM